MITVNRDNLESELNEKKSQLNIPRCYDISIDGVYMIKSSENEDEDRKYTLLFSVPIIPTAIYSNMDTDTEKVEISFVYHGAWKTIICDRSTISSKANIVKLADKGIPVDSENAKMLVVYLNRLINSSIATIEFKPSRSAMGWTYDGFMPFLSEIAFDGEDSFRPVYKQISERGKLQDWCDFIEPLISESLPLRMMLAASFASPLIERVGENPFVLHLFGKTGLAKTVALMTAMSVWGNPTPGGLVRTLNMTVNSMLSTAAFLNNIPFAGDELQTIKSRFESYDKLIMCITEGIDRGRMSFDRLSPVKTWRCAFITTGEDPCVLPNSGGGVKNRVIQIECNDPIIGKTASGNKVANFVKTHYGTAAKPYISEVAKRDVKSEYEQLYTDIIESGTDTTNKQAGAMSMLLLADKIACELFFPLLRPLCFDDVKCFMFTDADVDIAERAYQYICDKISENYNMFDEDAKTVWGKIDKAKNCCYINKSVLDKLLRDNSFDFDAVKTAWSKDGKISRQNGSRFRTVVRINGISTACVCIVLPPDESTKPPQNAAQKPEPSATGKTATEQEQDELWNLF